MLIEEGVSRRSSRCLWREACRGGVVYAYGGRRVGTE